jgi:uncharacterized membrane protein YbhN (UPF0104 family)
MRLTLSWRAALGFAAKAAISALILWLVAKRFDLTGVRASFDAASRPLLTAAFAAFLLIPVLGGLRWWIVLRGLGARTRLFEITAIFSAANVVGQILPSIAGDGFRVWLTVRRGHPLGVAVQSVFLERVFMVLALLTLALATAPLLAAHTGQPAAVWLFAALLAAGLCGLGVLMWADRLAAFVDARPLRPLARAAAQTRAMVLSRWGVWTAVASVAGNLTFALAAMMLGRALGVAATPLDFLAIMPAVTLATTLPLSLGGWGVREGAFVLLLGHVGVPAADALTLSLLYGVGGVLCGLPGMLAWALEGRANPAQNSVGWPDARPRSTLTLDRVG